MDKYRLIIFGYDWEVYLAAYNDLINDPKILYISTFRPKGLLGQIQRIHFNPRINKIIAIPFKEKWNYFFLRHIKKEQKTCFLILDNWLRMECGIRLLPYLKEKYPEAPIICYAQDLINTIIDVYSHKHIDVDYIKQYADLFISYDAIDAQKHGLLYHPTVFSPVTSKSSNHDLLYDLYFLGRDKGRLYSLVNICNNARNHGLRCKFIMLEIAPKQRIPCDGIVYLNTEISYQQNLEYCAQSKCIIELLQPNAGSPTFRTWEAIVLNKKLLTNNANIRSTEIYDKRYISFFNDERNIDWEFIKSEDAFPKQKNPYQEKIKPIKLIQFIEKQLQIQIEHT